MADEEREMAFLVASAAGPAGRPSPCPDDESLASVADSRAGEAMDATMEEHLVACVSCRALVAALAEPVPGEPPRTPAPPASAVFPRPFGPYTLERLLGQGGMGIVDEARHAQRGRPEALKVLRGGLGNLPDLLERFRLEVRAMAGITHDHVVPLYDSGQEGEDLYYTMPLLPGASLADVLRGVRATREVFPAAKSNEILDLHGFPRVAGEGVAPEVIYARRVAAALVGVADALAEIHGRGIIHRDLKPGNLLLDSRGRVLLADFGLVRWNDQRVTKTGQTLGTPAYMSPEQVLSDGKEPDGRADLYALGATLFELLTLRVPHEGDTIPETVSAKLSHRATPVGTFNPHVPADLEVLVGRCLERRREDRVADAGLMRDELSRFAKGEAVRVRALSPVARGMNVLRRNPLPWGVAAAVFAAASGWHFSRPSLLSVSSLPGAAVFLDGKEVASTPLTELRVAPGEHEIRLVRPRFATWARPVRMERGGRLEIDRTLLPEDPADPEALRALAAAVGLPMPEVKAEVHRGATGGPPFQLLFPRGRTLRAPGELRLWATDAAEGFRVVLEPADGSAALATWDLAPSAGGRVGLPVDDALRARLDGGGDFRIRLVDPDGKDRENGAFAVLPAAERESVAAAWGAVRARFPEGGASLPFLEIEFLRARGLHEEAYEKAVALQDDPLLRGRREVARAALAALDAAGLRDRGWWSAWVGLLREAEK